MRLAVDIGNTTISSALMKRGKVIKTWDILSTLPKAEIRQQLKTQSNQLKKLAPDVEVIICSVVPMLEALVATFFRKEFNQEVFIVGKNVVVPIANHYRYPKQVGQDRLVVAFAAKTLYGQPTIVIDLGTAITFDVVSKKGYYEGGMIVPGIKMSMESLFKKTAMLPMIKNIESPSALIGKTTKESILSGIFHGYGMMCSGLIDLIAGRIKGKPRVVVTGGYAYLMKSFIRNQRATIDPQLVFKGLYLLIKS